MASRDTIDGVASAPQTGNRYSYALNNPFSYTDPSGRFVKFVKQNPGLFASLALQMVPGVGDAYSFLTGAIGYDPPRWRRLNARRVALCDGIRLRL